MTEKNKNLLSGAIIVLSTLFVYIPAMQAGFIWDDDTFLTNNPLIQAQNGLYRFWFTTDAYDYFPLTYTTLWFEWRFWGTNPAGYHIVNILLHSVNSILLWQIVKTLKIPGAWLAGLIFAVHPVNVESVAWITERKNVLSMFFYLVTVSTFLRYQYDPRKRWYFISLGAFFLALSAKTSVVMLPFVLLGCLWWQKRVLKGKDFLQTLPFFLLSLIFGLITIWFQYNNAIGPVVVRDDSFLLRLITAGWAVWFYLYKAMIPHNLTFVYPRWQVDPFSILSYLPLFALILCFAFFWFYRKGWGRPFLAGFGYYVITLLPVLGFLDIYFMRYSLVSDHWQYVSIAGIIVLLVGLGSYLYITCSETQKKILKTVATLLILFFSLLTFNQGGIYKDQGTLWRDTIAKNRTAWMAHYNLGNFLLEQEKYNEAISHFKETLEIKPDHEMAHNNIGDALTNLGSNKEALFHFSESLRIDPDFAIARHNLNVTLNRLKNKEE